MACLRRTGDTRVSIAEISREAGISRQTIYAQFSDRIELVNAAVEDASLALARRLARATEGIEDPTEAIVEAAVQFCLAARRDPVIRMTVDMSVTPGLRQSGTISAQTLQMARGFIRPRLRDLPDASERLEEITETVVRFLLSVISHTSALTEDEVSLRAYLGRALGGAIDLH